MSLMNDQEWWEAQFDQEAAAETLRAAGLPFSHWRNNKPVFDGPVDWEAVQRVCRACPVQEIAPVQDSAPPEEPAALSPPPPNKKRKK